MSVSQLSCLSPRTEAVLLRLGPVTLDDGEGDWLLEVIDGSSVFASSIVAAAADYMTLSFFHLQWTSSYL